MGTMQRNKRIRKEIRGKARIRVLKRDARNLARTVELAGKAAASFATAVEKLTTAIADIPDAIRSDLRGFIPTGRKRDAP